MRAWTARRAIWLMAGFAIAFYTSSSLAQENSVNEGHPSEHPAATDCRAVAGCRPIAECVSCDQCPPSCRRQGYFRVMPYGWFPGMSVDLTVRGETAPVDVSIGKATDIIFSNLNFAAIGQIEASNGTVGIIANTVYADFSPEAQVRRLDFSSRLRMAFIDIAATYQPERVAEFLPCGSRFEVLAGFRYNSLSAGITVTGPRGNSVSAAGTEDWFDPIVGARFRIPLTEKLTGQVRGDVGGFDWGDASRFTWNVEATLEYRYSSRLFLFGGWRWLDIDYTTRSGNSEFGFDMHLSGPMAGIGFEF